MSDPKIFLAFDAPPSGTRGVAVASTAIARRATTSAEVAAEGAATATHAAVATEAPLAHRNDAPNVVRRSADCHSERGHIVRIRRDCDSRVIVDIGCGGRRRRRKRSGIRLRNPPLLPPPLNLPPHRTAYLAHGVLAFAVMGQYVPRRIAVRALPVLACRNVLPDAFGFRALRRRGARGVFVQGALLRVEEKDKVLLHLPRCRDFGNVPARISAALPHHVFDALYHGCIISRLRRGGSAYSIRAISRFLWTILSPVWD